ncbi:MAG: TetR/AcrR family transcriptional regulator [Myxococcaceae bacterium]|nr:TetR/AcrR family transcriptional regulator [Myxococcaceae bacterium]
MARPRKDEGRDTRREILDRALELFATKGFTGSSMRDIARAVGVRESALYHHFPNKQAILQTVLESTGPGAINSMMSTDLGALIGSMGAQPFVKMMGETLVTLWSTPQERHLLRLMMAELPRLKEAGLLDVQRQVTKVRARISGLFADLAKRGLVRPLDPDTTALRFMGPMMLIRLLHLADPTVEPDLIGARADLARHLDSFWESVAPEAPPTKGKRR